jgi:hypothetical protein
MKNFTSILIIIACLSCTKQIDQNGTGRTSSAKTAIKDSKEPIQLSTQRLKPGTTTAFTKYTIQQGAHSCDQSTLKFVSGSSMNFIAKFDNTAIYVLSNSAEATDVNKLYGFSEGIDNHQNSARIGWRYLYNRLELFAYVYVNGTLLRDATYTPPFIKTVEINTEINCSIAVSGAYYIFKVDGVEVRTPRGLTTTGFNGYQQYPYFGGTETAPHLMNFYIK